MIPLHKIQKEVTRPLLFPLQERAIAVFQRDYADIFQLILEVAENIVVHIKYYRIEQPDVEIVWSRAAMTNYIESYNETVNNIDWSTIIIRRS